MEIRAVLTPDREEKRQNGRRMKEDGEPMFTLTAQDRHGVAIIDDQDRTNKKLTPSDICPTLRAQSHGNEPKVIDVYNKRELKGGIVGTLTASGNTSIWHCGTFLVADYNDSNIQTDSNSPKVIGGVGEKTFGKQYPQGNRIYDVGHVSPALQANNGNASKGSIIIGGKNIRIRRLTPKECWRLQGWGFRQEDGSWDDTAFEKAKASGVSDSQLYKQAGNGCSANVVMAIGLTLKEIENSFS